MAEIKTQNTSGEDGGEALPWSAFSIDEADSIPSDPCVGYSREWAVGYWTKDDPDPLHTITIGSRDRDEYTARHVAKRLNAIWSEATPTALAAPAAKGGTEDVRKLAAFLSSEIDGLISESDGVAGLHQNGDIATWEELLPGGKYERLTSLDDLRHALTVIVPPAGSAGGSDVVSARLIPWEPGQQGVEITLTGGRSVAIPLSQTAGAAGGGSGDLHGRAWVAAEYRVAGSPHEWTDEDALAMARYILAGPAPSQPHPAAQAGDGGGR